MFDYIDRNRVLKFWTYGPKTVQNTVANESIYKSGFSTEEKDFDVYLLLNRKHMISIERHAYPDKVRNKNVVSFPQLSVSYIKMRTCYENVDKFKHPTDLIMDKGTGTRMVTEVYCMLYDKNKNGGYDAVMPIILWAKGYQGEFLYNCFRMFSAQLAYVYQKKFIAQQFVVDLKFSGEQMVVGSGVKKNNKYSGIRSEVYPIELYPTVLSIHSIDLEKENQIELMKRQLSREQFATVIPLHNNSLAWAGDWANGSEYMKDQIQQFREYEKWKNVQQK